jgi:hypothetical protein
MDLDADPGGPKTYGSYGYGSRSATPDWTVYNFLEVSCYHACRGKTMVHEWAKLRWGVYEEHGYPGDPKFPMFFLKSTWTVNGPESKVVINLCLNEDPVGYEQVLGQ